MTWSWVPVTGAEVPELVRMAQDYFETEIDQIFQPDPIAYSRNLLMASVQQFYQPGTQLLIAAKDINTNAILGYVWANSLEKTAWSDEAMISIRMVHLALTLPVRVRIRLICDMIAQWEAWAVQSGVAIVCSTTMRGDQSGFLELHRRCGYDVRGSFAFKRLNTTPVGLPIPVMPSEESGKTH